MGLIASIKREVIRMSRRPLYLLMCTIVPLACAYFFMDLLSPALPLKTPSAVVDLDQSPMSRQLERALNASENVDIQYKLESYDEAMRYVREGKIFAFFVIPDRYEKNALAGNKPTLEYYTNMTYFVPGTLSFKGFKVVAVSASGSIIDAKLSSVGLTDDLIEPLLQPVKINAHGIGNPWTNYSYYLTPSFLLATISLLVMIVAAFSITLEIKHGTSPQWLTTANGNIAVALAGKLLPQTALFTVVTLAAEGVMFGLLHFPMHGSAFWLVVATVLFVVAAQAFAVFICSLLPNPRLSMSIISLVGVLTFSFAGFSFPVEDMYGAIGIFSYIAPPRYMFLIYVNNCLNGWSPYYVRWLYVALALFPVVSTIFLGKLKRALMQPVYVP